LSKVYMVLATQTISNIFRFESLTMKSHLARCWMTDDKSHQHHQSRGGTTIDVMPV